jgi:hypothetical protein
MALALGYKHATDRNTAKRNGAPCATTIIKRNRRSGVTPIGVQPFPSATRIPA